jgi:DEAD/DEAH box helicase domain-containing protein
MDPSASVALSRRRPAADLRAFLGEIARERDYEGQIAHVEEVAARPAAYGDLDAPLAASLLTALARLGVERLYTHQAEAVSRARAGEDLVVVTGTASGKSLCYNLPVIERLLAEAEATALYLFPTKALAQDQRKGLARLVEGDLARAVRLGVYDGDTTADARRKIRETSNLVLTNPDMLHAGILPNHGRWARFFEGLRYVVVDEVHSYRGIFGSNVANVLRRLSRVAAHYGASPAFLCASATIANPGELVARLVGRRAAVVDRDGSPRGRRFFVLWNPPYAGEDRVERRSSNVEGERLFVRLVERGVQTIAFAKARVVAELIYRYAREELARRAPSLAGDVAVYRAGFLPAERRELERRLFSGELLGVASTNALELGIDIGGLDASILVGFPGTIASAWQQAGRAGRGLDDSLAILVAYNDPIDQYLVRHPDYFFGRTPEHAILDPENTHILARHLKCAARELPLTDDDASLFGDSFAPIVRILEEEGVTKEIHGLHYWASEAFPTRETSLRTISDNTFSIVDVGPARAAHRERVAREGMAGAIGGAPPSGVGGPGSVRAPHDPAARAAPGSRAGAPGAARDADAKPALIGNVDAISAPELLYPEAIYLHNGETYLVRRLDLEGRVAEVERAEVDYYTQPILETKIRAGDTREARDVAGARLELVDATVTWLTSGFKKIRFYAVDSVGYGKLDLPPQHLATVALALVPHAETMARVTREGLAAREGLVGLKNLFVSTLPLFAMCDPQDLGGITESSNRGAPALFIYDRFSGGLGFAQKGFDLFETLLAAARDLVEGCPCAGGCPSCVGLPILRPAQHQDPDVGGSWPIPSKDATRALIAALGAGA